MKKKERKHIANASYQAALDEERHHSIPTYSTKYHAPNYLTLPTMDLISLPVPLLGAIYMPICLSVC